jgi:hypothetical protein
VCARHYNTYCENNSTIRNYYAGAAPGRCINNCGLENQNKELKKLVGNAASLNNFFNGTAEYLHNTSMARDPLYENNIKFEDDVKMTSKLWTGGFYIKTQSALDIVESCWRIVKLQADIIEGAYMLVEREHDESFFVGSNDYREEKVDKLVRKYLDNSWCTIQELNEFMSYYSLVLPMNGSLYCHCEQHTREYVCEHTIAVQLLNGSLQMPVKEIQFKQKYRKAGRPKLQHRYYKDSDFTQQFAPNVAENEDNANDEGNILGTK